MSHPNLAVIAGVGVVANRDDDRIVHPITLIEEATRLALADAGVEAADIGAVYASPMSVAGTEHAADLLAARLGLPPGARVEASYSGAGPQRLLAEASALVADGSITAAIVIGGIADASVRRARRRGIDPPAPPTARWSQGSQQARHEATGHPAWTTYIAEVGAGAAMPPSMFALVESVLGAGADPDAHRLRLGRLLAPFTEVAAHHPDLAWFPVARTAEELATPTPDNRFIAEPYTKRMCSFPTVDQAAAIVVTRADRADGRAVYPHAIGACREVGAPSTRPDMGRSVALERAAEVALERAGIGSDDVARFDLYSCFPSAVQLAAAALGLPADDPRPWTTTGGLPFFGGPGAAYSLSGIACMVEDLRADPGSVGAVVGVGGMVDDFSVGIYSTAPRPFAHADLGTVDDIGPIVDEHGSGPAVIEAMTVLHDRDRGPVAVPVIARFADGSRIGARAADPELAAAVSGTSLVGRDITVTTTDGKARYSLA